MLQALALHFKGFCVVSQGALRLCQTAITMSDRDLASTAPAEWGMLADRGPHVQHLECCQLWVPWCKGLLHTMSR